tara:strand:+ start:1055 stop:1258 length:204 start_codon:yes stop_codon:yes gene_type:complete
MWDRLKKLLLETEEDRKEVARRKRDDIKSGRMSRPQRVARAFTKATRRGRKKTAASLLSHYKSLDPK